MRYPNSLFDRACQYINKVPVGRVFKTSDYTDQVGSYEKSTRWKQYSKNPFYVTMGYKTDLKRGGFITMVKRGVWMVNRHVPDWFDAGHLQFINGNGYDYKKQKRLTHYDGMTKEQILARLRWGSIPKDTDTSIIEAYPANVEGSREFFDTVSHPGTISPAAHMTEIETEFKVNGSVGCTVAKITKEESQFADQPKRDIPTQEIVNLGLLRSAVASLDLITTSDSILHARVLNALVILTDIEKSMSDKIDAQLFKGKL
jgi:hypothetical protein